MNKIIYCFFLILMSCNNREEHMDDSSNPVISTSPEKIMMAEIAKYPDSLLLRENLVQLYSDKGDYLNALKIVDDAIVKDSVNARLWNIKAVIHFEDADTVKAIRAFEHALKISPDQKSIISLGTLYAQTKNPLALDMADFLLEKTKAEKEAYYIKGLYFSFNRESEKAIVFFDKCLTLNFTFMDGYREKAIALYDLGKYEEALSILDKAITLQNNFDEGYYYSGRCLEKLNRKEEAIQAYKNALVYDPEYIEAKEALKNLGVPK